MEKKAEKMRALLRLVVKKEVRRKMIAEAAYYRAEKRGFQNGDAVGNWLAAEAAVDQKLMDAFLYYTQPVPKGNAEMVEEYALLN